jgi:hypothetical protein
MRALKLAGERLQPGQRGIVVIELPCRAQPALDGGAVTLGQVLEDVAFLVTNTPL